LENSIAISIAIFLPPSIAIAIAMHFASIADNPAKRPVQSDVKEGYLSKKWLFNRCWLV